MAENIKTLKQYCKEAKKRLKTGFWENYDRDLKSEIKRADKIGVSPSRIKEYYSRKVADTIRKTGDEFEVFYKKVKKLLDEEGEVSDAIGRLTESKVFESLSYEEKQKYTFKLSEQYILALERYNKERFLNVN